MGRFLVIAAAVAFGSLGSASLAGAQDAQGQRGIAVYAAQKCSLCHKIAGVGKRTTLDGVGAKLSPDEIRLWLTDAKTAATKAKSTAKPVMKDYSKLPAADIDALVAYMKTLTTK
jgi:mono/diheme cytochrome c family protein